MKKLIFLGIIAGLGLYGYNNYFGPTAKTYRAAYEAYEIFADFVLKEEWGEAAYYVIGDSQADSILKQGIKRSAKKLQKGNISLNIQKPAIYYAKRTVQSRSISADGQEVTFSIVQQSRTGPAGQKRASVKPDLWESWQDVVVINTEDGWAVEKFEEVKEIIEEGGAIPFKPDNAVKKFFN